jgi:hypothetical protein
MSVELTVVNILLKILRDDPTAAQLKLLNERVQRLAYGFCVDGANALEDAIEQSNVIERERLVKGALEYFRQGYSRNEAPWASLCAECVARSYQALGKPQDSQRWMLRAWERLLSDHKAEHDRIRQIYKPNLIQGLKTDFSSQQLKFDTMRLKNMIIGQSRLVYELVDLPNSGGEQWQNIFLLEAQAGRVLLHLQQINAQPSANLAFIFPRDAKRPVFISGKKTVIGYVCYHDQIHLCYRYSDEKLRSMGMKDRRILPRGEQSGENILGLTPGEQAAFRAFLGLCEPGDD